MNDTEYIELIKGYSLDHLQDGLRNLDRDKHPQRVAMLEEQIVERKKAGEIVDSIVTSARDPLWRQPVSWDTAFAVWWAFIWRSLLACIPLNFLALIGLALLNKALDIPPLLFALAFQCTAILIAALVGVVVMKAILSKKYKNMVIFVLEEENPNKKMQATPQ
jgi:hypothetical protein